MNPSRRLPQHDPFSSRETEILRLLAEGLSDREIANRLVITTGTVKWYNRQIYSKLGVGSRTQAIARAHDLGILEDAARSEGSAQEVAAIPGRHLPAELTRFIGRKREIASIKRLLHTARLLTLVGPPGTGKTRLALSVAREVADSFREGVCFIPLAPISDAALVINSIAAAIGVNVVPGLPLIDTLGISLHGMQILLVLDNFEHLLQAAAQVAELLAAAPALKIVVTSREALHIYGEQQYAAPPMELPIPEDLDLAALKECESVALFVQRAQAVKPDFELTVDNMLDIAKICVRLEGLPLSIELAAARVKVLPPRALLARLGKQLDVLADGPRDFPARQQTLRQTIDWSYQFLDDAEQILFRRLAVFAGGWTLEAVEIICGEGLDRAVLDTLASLVDKNLVRQEVGLDSEPRFTLLEMIREYALERLQTNDEVSALREAHAEFFTTFAATGAERLITQEQLLWHKRLEAELDNFRAAMSWSLASKRPQRGMQIVDSLIFFWYLGNHVAEACQWFDQLLEAGDDVPSDLRAKVLTSAGVVNFYRGDHLRGATLCRAALELARQIGKRRTTAWALCFLGANVMNPGMMPEEFQRVMGFFDEALTLFQQVQDRWGTARILTVKGEITRLQGDYEKAGAFYQESLILFRDLGNVWGIRMALSNLGYVALHQQEIDRARPLFFEALGLCYEMADRQGIATVLIGLAGAAVLMEDSERAATLFGAGEALFESIGVSVAPGDRLDYERSVAAVRAALEPAVFDSRWAQGRKTTLDQATTFALEIRN